MKRISLRFSTVTAVAQARPVLVPTPPDFPGQYPGNATRKRKEETSKQTTGFEDREGAERSSYDGLRGARKRSLGIRGRRFGSEYDAR